MAHVDARVHQFADGEFVREGCKVCDGCEESELGARLWMEVEREASWRSIIWGCTRSFHVRSDERRQTGTQTMI